MLENLQRNSVIQEREKNYFKFNFKNVINLGKLYLLPKGHKNLSNVPGRLAILNCETPTEKVSEFLDHQLQSIIKQGNSYINDTVDYLEKLREIKEILKEPHQMLWGYTVVALMIKVWKFDKFIDKTVPTDDIFKIAEFDLENNFFKFTSKFYIQISGTAIPTKFAQPYACIFLDYIKTEFLNSKEIKLWLWKRFIDDIFFIWSDPEESLDKFLEDLDKFHPKLRFIYEKLREKINFLDVVIKIKEVKITTNLFYKPTDGQQYLHYDSCHAEHIRISTVFKETLLLKRIWSGKNDLHSNGENLKEWFMKRG